MRPISGVLICVVATLLAPSQISAQCVDCDGDGYAQVDDCDDTDGLTYPGAQQYCEGQNTDCLDPDYPAAPGQEIDMDNDGFLPCSSSCNKPMTANNIRPGITYRNTWARDPVVHWNGSELVLMYEREASHDRHITWQRHDRYGGLNAPAEIVGWSGGAGSGSYPNLVWHGSGYAIIWTNNADRAVQFRLFSSTGEPESQLKNSIRVDEYFRHTRAAWMGSEYGVIWRVSRSWENETRPAGLYFARLDADGDLVQDSVQLLSENAADNSYPSMAWTGREMAVAWVAASGGQLSLALLDAEGDLIWQRVAVQRMNHPVNPSLAWNGETFGLTWADQRHGNSHVFLSLWDTSGSQIQPDSQLSVGEGEYINPSIVSAADSLLVGWIARETDDIAQAMLLSHTGQSLDGTIWSGPDLGLSHNPIPPSIAWADSRIFITYSIDDGIPETDGYELHLWMPKCMDCNDADASVFPLAPELADGLDNQCPGDPGYGEIDEGLSLADYCPPCRDWRNHGEYIRCMNNAITGLITNGTISKEAGRSELSAAVRSDIGKKGYVAPECAP